MHYYYYFSIRESASWVSYQAESVFTELELPLYGFINHHTGSVYSNIHSNPKQLIWSQNMTQRLNTISPDQANFVTYCYIPFSAAVKLQNSTLENKYKKQQLEGHISSWPPVFKAPASIWLCLSELCPEKQSKLKCFLSPVLVEDENIHLGLSGYTDFVWTCC